MKNNQEFMLEKYTNPVPLAALAGGLSLLFMIVGKLAGMEGMIGSKAEFPWMTAAAFLLFYIISSSAMSLIATDFNAYWKKAILTFIVLLALNCLLAYLFSSFTWLSEVGSYSFIFFILILTYVILQVFARFIKKIMQFASRDQEENA